MVKEIKSKWYSEKYGIIITAEKLTIRISDLQVLNREWSSNRIVFRARTENKRIGEKSLMKSLIKKEVTIQEYCPF